MQNPFSVNVLFLSFLTLIPISEKYFIQLFGKSHVLKKHLIKITFLVYMLLQSWLLSPKTLRGGPLCRLTQDATKGVSKYVPCRGLGDGSSRFSLDACVQASPQEKVFEIYQKQLLFSVAEQEIAYYKYIHTELTSNILNGKQNLKNLFFFFSQPSYSQYTLCRI